MKNPMTAEELKQIPEFFDEDKKDIEDMVWDMVAGKDENINTPLAKNLRGFLAGMLLDSGDYGDNRDLNYNLEQTASAFADGWNYAMREAAPK